MFSFRQSGENDVEVKSIRGFLEEKGLQRYLVTFSEVAQKVFGQPLQCEECLMGENNYNVSLTLY